MSLFTLEQRAIISAVQEIALGKVSAPGVLVNAVAGSGKTRTLIESVKTLLCNGVTPDDIIVITFTRNAAEQLQHRLGLQDSGMMVDTFHAIAMRLVDAHGDCAPAFAFTWAGIDNDDGNDDGGGGGKSIYGLCEYPGKLNAWLKESEDGRSFARGIRFLVIDEYQDCDELQCEILKEFTNASVLAFGDEDQNIFTWRGSGSGKGRSAFTGLKQMSMTENFRSSPEIVAIANTLLPGTNTTPMFTSSRCTGLLPTLVYAKSRSEEIRYAVYMIETWVALGVPLNQCAILSNENRILNMIEEEMILCGIPCTRLRSDKDNLSIAIITIHTAKGLEWDNVIITGCSDSSFPRFKDSDDQVNENRRVFYVAVTRARKKLVMTFSGSSSTPSRFLVPALKNRHKVVDIDGIDDATIQAGIKIIEMTRPRSRSSPLSRNGYTPSRTCMSVRETMRRLKPDDFTQMRERGILPLHVYSDDDGFNCKFNCNNNNASLGMTRSRFVEEQGLDNSFCEIARAAILLSLNLTPVTSAVIAAETNYSEDVPLSHAVPLREALAMLSRNPCAQTVREHPRALILYAALLSASETTNRGRKRLFHVTPDEMSLDASFASAAESSAHSLRRIGKVELRDSVYLASKNGDTACLSAPVFVGGYLLTFCSQQPDAETIAASIISLAMTIRWHDSHSHTGSYDSTTRPKGGGTRPDTDKILFFDVVSGTVWVVKMQMQMQMQVVNENESSEMRSTSTSSASSSSFDVSSIIGFTKEILDRGA